MITPEKFIDMFTGEPGSRNPPPLYGTIPSTYVAGTGRPPIKFDGEDVASTRTWPYLGSYNPAPNDRVVVVFINNSGLILGKII